MNKHPYSSVGSEQMILRDHLAVERTDLANERTLLAYVRTAIALLAAGASLIHFFQSPASVGAGWLLLASGAAVILVGGWRYRAMAKRIDAIRNPSS